MFESRGALYTLEGPIPDLPARLRIVLPLLGDLFAAVRANDPTATLRKDPRLDRIAAGTELATRQRAELVIDTHMGEQFAGVEFHARATRRKHEIWLKSQLEWAFFTSIDPEIRTRLGAVLTVLPFERSRVTIVSAEEQAWQRFN